MDCLGIGITFTTSQTKADQVVESMGSYRPCAALKATCHDSTRGTVTHHFKPMEIKVKEFLNNPVFLEICRSNTTEL